MVLHSLHVKSLTVNAKGIQHICTAPYHPASNGAIERFVQIFKQAMRLEREMVCLSSTVYRTFLCYIGAHHTQLLVRYAGNKHGRSNIMMPEQVSDSLQLAPVMVREGRDKSVWKPGTILEHWYPVSYLVRWMGGRCNGSMWITSEKFLLNLQ